MSPLTYFTHLLGLWRVVLSADFKERKLIAVVVVHPFTEVVTDVESPAGSENGKETRARLWASAVPCFGLVIIKKIRFSHKQWLKSRSNPVCDSVSFVPQVFPSAVSHTVIRSRTSPCSGGGSDLSSTLCCRFQREKAITHSMFCFVVFFLCMCYSTRASQGHVFYVIHREDLKGPGWRELRGAGSSG